VFTLRWEYWGHPI